MSIDRPGLFRTQIRAFLRAAEGHELRIMIPMVSTSHEMDLIRALVDKEVELLHRRGYELPTEVHVGAMIEVPALLFELEDVLPKVDFISVGSNDLMQFLYAADRTNARVASRFDSLAVAPMRALKTLVVAAERHNVPVTVCGEMAGRPIEAMALIGLGLRSLSMAPASVGPVKTMILSLNARKITDLIDKALKGRDGELRERLRRFAENENIEIG
jgi:phosphotransferase system enzyme I (PtsP)